jgi:hypothetical protein
MLSIRDGRPVFSSRTTVRIAQIQLFFNSPLPRSTDEEMPHIFMNSKGHPCDHRSPSLDPAVNQMNSVYTVSSISLMINLLSFHLDPDLPGGFFALDFLSIILYPDLY